jgi:hypothetical protein
MRMFQSIFKRRSLGPAELSSIDIIEGIEDAVFVSVDSRFQDEKLREAGGGLSSLHIVVWPGLQDGSYGPVRRVGSAAGKEDARDFCAVHALHWLVLPGCGVIEPLEECFELEDVFRWTLSVPVGRNEKYECQFTGIMLPLFMVIRLPGWILYHPPATEWGADSSGVCARLRVFDPVVVQILCDSSNTVCELSGVAAIGWADVLVTGIFS